MTDMLQEFCDSRGVSMRVDREAGVIRGVKVLGLESRNGRAYLPEALAQAAPLYENAKVNVNHPKGHPTAPRDYQDRIGTLRRVEVRADGLFGDFHFNPKHALAEQLMWDAERAPENVGFSHNVEARVARQGERVVVEAITRVQSVDLVADPATTRGLFESTSSGDTASSEPVESAKSLTLEEFREKHPELVEQIRQERASEVESLRREVERLATLEELRRKHDLAKKLLCEFELPGIDTIEPLARTVVSERFFETLLAAADESAMRALVEERARLVRALSGGDGAGASACRRPRSREQHLVDAMNSKSFVEVIT